MSSTKHQEAMKNITRVEKKPEENKEISSGDMSLVNTETYIFRS